MYRTFETTDFTIYVFDSNDIPIENICKIKVEDLYFKINNTNIKNVAFISPANSLLFMDGGVDKGYMNCINNIQEKAQLGAKKLGIKTLLGRNYLPIGTSMSIPINEKITLISAPTMFLPQKVIETQNPYYALKSALQLCKQIGIKIIFCPMMCTGYGGFSYKDAYELMRKAINDYKDFENYNIYKNDIYTYNILNENLIKEITAEQPRIYCNTEFFVKI